LGPGRATVATAHGLAITASRCARWKAKTKQQQDRLAHLREDADEEDRRARLSVARWEEACQSPGMMAALMAEDDRLQSSFTAAVIAREASQETAVSAVRHSDAQIVKLAQGSVLAKHVRQQAIAQLAHRQACLF